MCCLKWKVPPGSRCSLVGIRCRSCFWNEVWRHSRLSNALRYRFSPSYRSPCVFHVPPLLFLLLQDSSSASMKMYVFGGKDERGGGVVPITVEGRMVDARLWFRFIFLGGAGKFSAEGHLVMLGLDAVIAFRFEGKVVSIAGGSPFFTIFGHAPKLFNDYRCVFSTSMPPKYFYLLWVMKSGKNI